MGGPKQLFLDIKAIVTPMPAAIVPYVHNVNGCYYGDTYDILNSKNVDYSACVVELVDSSVTGSFTIDKVRITLVDKLQEDEGNLLDIYDEESQLLMDILYNLIEVYNYQIDTDVTINLINQDFADKLGGVYADITVPRLSYRCNFDVPSNERSSSVGEDQNT